MDQEQMAAGLNEWMRRYTDDPAAFEAEFKYVGRFLAEKANGQTPTYGEQSAAYLEQLVSELAGATAAAPAPVPTPATAP